MAPNSKRSGEVAAAAAAKKARVAKVVDPVVVMCQNVAEGLEMAELSGPCRATLAAMISQSIGAPKNQRHKHQDTVVGMLESALKGVEARLAGLVAERQGVLDGVKAEKQELESAREAALAALTAKLAEVEEWQAAQRTCGAVHEERATGLEAARASQAEAAAAAQAVRASQRKCDAANVGPLAALQGGSWEDPAEAKAHAAELVALGRELAFDQSLLSGLPMAVVKKQEERGTFDATIVQQYEVELQKATASFAESFLELEAAQAARAEKAQAAEALCAAAREELQRAEGAVATTEAEFAEVSKQDTAATKALKDFAPRLKKAQSAWSGDNAELHAFLTTYMSTFEVLRDREVESEAAAVAA